MADSDPRRGNEEYKRQVDVLDSKNESFQHKVIELEMKVGLLQNNMDGARWLTSVCCICLSNEKDSSVPCNSTCSAYSNRWLEDHGRGFVCRSQFFAFGLEKGFIITERVSGSRNIADRLHFSVAETRIEDGKVGYQQSFVWSNWLEINQLDKEYKVVLCRGPPDLKNPIPVIFSFRRRGGLASLVDCFQLSFAF